MFGKSNIYREKYNAYKEKRRLEERQKKSQNMGLAKQIIMEGI